MPSSRHRSIAWLAIALLAPATAHAWLRSSYEDPVLVDRSELIVVAHVKKDSIVYVLHATSANEGRSWEHHATLVVTEVLKGQLPSLPSEIPIIIHYGLAPVVGGVVQRDSFFADVRRGGTEYPRDRIEIIDNGNSAVGSEPLVEDAGHDNLWFLRRLGGIHGTPSPGGALGIVDPEDLQPLSLRSYFRAYLAASPERAVAAEMECNPAVVARGRRFLDHLAIQRVLRIADPKERIARLMPFFFRRSGWQGEVRHGIAACGAHAGPALLEAFRDPARAALRTDLIGLLGEVRYAGAVDPLIDLLRAHDRFWGTQHLDPGWWNQVEAPLTRQRRQIYGEVYAAVLALDKIASPRAAPALEQTLHRWQSISFDNPEIAEATQQALHHLTKP